jgi:hypothetical protein
MEAVGRAVVGAVVTEVRRARVHVVMGRAVVLAVATEAAGVAVAARAAAVAAGMGAGGTARRASVPVSASSPT